MEEKLKPAPLGITSFRKLFDAPDQEFDILRGVVPGRLHFAVEFALSQNRMLWRWCRLRLREGDPHQQRQHCYWSEPASSKRGGTSSRNLSWLSFFPPIA